MALTTLIVSTRTQNKVVLFSISNPENPVVVTPDILLPTSPDDVRFWMSSLRYDRYLTISSESSTMTPLPVVPGLFVYDLLNANSLIGIGSVPTMPSVSRASGDPFYQVVSYLTTLENNGQILFIRGKISGGYLVTVVGVLDISAQLFHFTPGSPQDLFSLKQTSTDFFLTNPANGIDFTNASDANLAFPLRFSFSHGTSTLTVRTRAIETTLGRYQANVGGNEDSPLGDPTGMLARSFWPTNVVFHGVNNQGELIGFSPTVFNLEDLPENQDELLAFLQGLEDNKVFLRSVGDILRFGLINNAQDNALVPIPQDVAAFVEFVDDDLDYQAYLYLVWREQNSNLLKESPRPLLRIGIVFKIFGISRDTNPDSITFNLPVLVSENLVTSTIGNRTVQRENSESAIGIIHEVFVKNDKLYIFHDKTKSSPNLQISVFQITKNHAALSVTIQTSKVGTYDYPEAGETITSPIFGTKSVFHDDGRHFYSTGSGSALVSALNIFDLDNLGTFRIKKTEYTPFDGGGPDTLMPSWLELGPPLGEILDTIELGPPQCRLVSPEDLTDELPTNFQIVLDIFDLSDKDGIPPSGMDLDRTILEVDIQGPHGNSHYIVFSSGSFWSDFDQGSSLTPLQNESGYRFTILKDLPYPDSSEVHLNTIAYDNNGSRTLCSYVFATTDEMPPSCSMLNDFPPTLKIEDEPVTQNIQIKTGVNLSTIEIREVETPGGFEIEHVVFVNGAFTEPYATLSSYIGNALDGYTFTIRREIPYIPGIEEVKLIAKASDFNDNQMPFEDCLNTFTPRPNDPEEIEGPICTGEFFQPNPGDPNGQWPHQNLTPISFTIEDPDNILLSSVKIWVTIVEGNNISEDMAFQDSAFTPRYNNVLSTVIPQDEATSRIYTFSVYKTGGWPVGSVVFLTIYAEDTNGNPGRCVAALIIRQQQNGNGNNGNGQAASCSTGAESYPPIADPAYFTPPAVSVELDTQGRPAKKTITCAFPLGSSVTLFQTNRLDQYGYSEDIPDIDVSGENLLQDGLVIITTDGVFKKKT